MQATINEAGDELTLKIPIDKKGTPSKSGRSMIHYMTDPKGWDILPVTLNGHTVNAKVTIAAFEPRQQKKPDAPENDGGI